jgi:hypothetical protein
MSLSGIRRSVVRELTPRRALHQHAMSGEVVLVTRSLLRYNAIANLRANQTKCERSELPQIARQVQRTLWCSHNKLKCEPGAHPRHNLG